MRFSILAVMFCAGTMAFCQSSGSGLGSFDEPANGQTAAPPSIEKFSPSWHPGTLEPGGTSTQAGRDFSWKWDSTKIYPRNESHSIIHFPADRPAISGLAQNDPFVPKQLKEWPNARMEPIPTQWPDARLEPIPTQWPNLKYSLVEGQAGAPAAAQNTTK